MLLAVLFLPRLRNARYLWDHFVYRIKQDLAFCHIYSKIIETQFLPGKFTFDLIFWSFCHTSPKMVAKEILLRKMTEEINLETILAQNICHICEAILGQELDLIMGHKNQSRNNSRSGTCWSSISPCPTSGYAWSPCRSPWRRSRSLSLSLKSLSHCHVIEISLVILIPL